MSFPNHYYLLLSNHYNGRYDESMIGGLVCGMIWVGLRWKIVVDDVKGGGDYLKGVQLSPSNELSGELSCGLMWRVQAEISG